MDKFLTRYRGNVICETIYDQNNNLVLATWKGYTDTNSVMKWGEAYLKLMKKHHCPYILNDDRKSIGPWHESIEWLENYLTPKLIDAGLRYYAHIVSENVFGSVSAEKLESKIGQKLTMKLFRTSEDGMEWLLKMMKSNQVN